jgi:hypothetical protein
MRFSPFVPDTIQTGPAGVITRTSPTLHPERCSWAKDSSELKNVVTITFNCLLNKGMKTAHPASRKVTLAITALDFLQGILPPANFPVFFHVSTSPWPKLLYTI